VLGGQGAVGGVHRASV